MTWLLGLDFADLTAADAAARIAGRSADANFAYIVTPNADHLARLARLPGLAPLYEDAALRLLDSRVVARAARLMGLPAPPVATGSDVTALLLRMHLHPGERITVVGVAPPHLASLCTRLRLAPPAHCNPPCGFDEDAAAFQATVDFVRANPARFIFLAVGSPRQEWLAHAIAAAGDARGTGLCIGASLEFLAGVRRRAPRWMQHAGLEWLWRLCTEPRRLARRYLLEDWRVLAALWRARRFPDR